MFRDNIKNRIYIAEFARDSFDVALKYGIGMEINHTCVSDNLNKEVRRETVAYIRERLKSTEAHGGYLVVHGPFTELSPMSIDSRAVTLTWDRLSEALEIAVELGAKKMIAHTGYFPFLYYPQWYREKSLEFWPKFMKTMPEDFTLCVENVFEEDPLIFREIFENAESHRLRACVDVGHITAMAGNDWPAERWIEYLGDYIGHFHLHNNRGGKVDLHDSFNKGKMNPFSVMEAVEKHCRDDVTLTVESQWGEESTRWLFDYFGIGEGK